MCKNLAVFKVKVISKLKLNVHICSAISPKNTEKNIYKSKNLQSEWIVLDKIEENIFGKVCTEICVDISVSLCIDVYGCCLHFSVMQ